MTTKISTENTKSNYLGTLKSKQDWVNWEEKPKLETVLIQGWVTCIFFPTFSSNIYQWGSLQQSCCRRCREENSKEPHFTGQKTEKMGPWKLDSVEGITEERTGERILKSCVCMNMAQIPDSTLSWACVGQTQINSRLWELSYDLKHQTNPWGGHMWNKPKIAWQRLWKLNWHWTNRTQKVR